MWSEVIVIVIPETVDVEGAAYEPKDFNHIVTEGSAWTIDVEEFGWGRVRPAIL